MITFHPVERVVLTHLQIPFKEPFRISAGEVGIKDAILIAIETSALLAFGESSPMASGFGYSSDTPEQCWTELEQTIVPSLLGKTVRSTTEVAELSATWKGSRFAVAGAETALWDLLGQAGSASISELLGASVSRVDQGIESGLAVGLYPSIVDLIETIEAHLTAGYRRVKIKIAPGQDLELVRAVRHHFGDVPLMVDANAAYSVADIDLFRELDDYDLLMFEQPMAADDLSGLAALQAAVNTPVCIDESADTLERTALAIELGACRIVNLKLQRVGGIGPAIEIHNLCHKHEIACWVGCMPELGIGQAAGIHLATLPNCKYPSDIEPSARWFVDDYVVPLIDFASPGLLEVPTRPGLGYMIDLAKLDRYKIRQQEFSVKTIG
jgi:O-succinylbenzoate synthase